jgi:hypothetical protein
MSVITINMIKAWIGRPYRAATITAAAAPMTGAISAGRL